MRSHACRTLISITIASASVRDWATHLREGHQGLTLLQAVSLWSRRRSSGAAIQAFPWKEGCRRRFWLRRFEVLEVLEVLTSDCVAPGGCDGEESAEGRDKDIEHVHVYYRPCNRETLSFR
jgi:hypothetical protein